jgi:hypothetical protein
MDGGGGGGGVVVNHSNTSMVVTMHGLSTDKQDHQPTQWYTVTVDVQRHRYTCYHT